MFLTGLDNYLTAVLSLSMSKMLYSTFEEKMVPLALLKKNTIITRSSS